MEKAKFLDTGVGKSIAGLLNKQDHKKLTLWATDCAEHVLIYFEEQSAIHAATYAAKAAYAAGSADAKERDWQYRQLLDLGDNH